MTFIKKGFQSLLEWILCCPMEDEEQFDENLNELYTVIMPISLFGTVVGTLLFLMVYYYF